MSKCDRLTLGIRPSQDSTERRWLQTHLSEARHLGGSQALRMVLRTSSRDGAEVPTASAVGREHNCFTEPDTEVSVQKSQ
jgi:hypothetical protein